MEPNEIEKLSKEYQDVQEKLQALEFQKLQFDAQKQEYDNTENEIINATQKIYMIIGGVMIETTKEKAEENLKEKKESISLRLSIIAKQQETTIQKEKELREELTKIFNSQNNNKIQ